MVKGGQSNKSGPRYGSGYQLGSLAIQGQTVQTNTENIGGGGSIQWIRIKKCFYVYMEENTAV